MTLYLVWPDWHFARAVKSRAGKKLTTLRRRVAYGFQARVDDLINMSQCAFRLINTAFIE